MKQPEQTTARVWLYQRTHGLALAMLLAGLLVSRASAHIEVNPVSVRPSSNYAFTVRVPNEKDEPTIQLRIEFPDTLTVSRFQPKAGWQRTVDKNAAGRLTAVTWQGGQIGAGEYDEFTFLARTPPTTAPLVFKAYQTYQSGATVNWVNGADADDPAPVVAVTAAEAPGPTPAADTTGLPPTRLSTASAAISLTATLASVSKTAIIPPADGPTSAVSRPPSDNPGDYPADLPLFAALGAVLLAVTALVVAGVALTRRSGLL